MSERKPIIADDALLEQMQAAQARFDSLVREAEANLERSEMYVARMDRLIELAGKLAETGPNMLLPDGPLPFFPADMVIEIIKAAYKGAMFDVLKAIEGDFAHLEAESQPHVLPFAAPEFGAFDDAAIAEA